MIIIIISDLKHTNSWASQPCCIRNKYVINSATLSRISHNVKVDPLIVSYVGKTARPVLLSYNLTVLLYTARRHIF